MDKPNVDRNQLVVKSNALIQKTRYSLSLQEQKVILYVISKIKPTDDDFETYSFSLRELCDVCGVTYNGKNYMDFKNVIKALHDKSFWLRTETGESLCTWVNKVWIENRGQTVRIRLDEVLRPYLLQLKENFTSYELGYILVMHSKYSVRMYELLKSYSYIGEVRLSLDELKDRLQTDGYSDYKNFRVRVLDKAISEINEFTDLRVEYKQIRMKRAVAELVFSITKKSSIEEVAVRVRREAEIERKHAEN